MEESNLESSSEPQKAIGKRYKSFCAFALVALNIFCSPFYFGYSLAYLSTIKLDTLVSVFHITIQESTAQGLLTGCVPVGAGFGALASGILIKYLSRKQSFLLVNAVALLAGGLLMIPNMYSLIIARLIQGLCTGVFSAISPMFIKQFSPVELSGTFGAANQVFLVLGITFSYTFSYILSLAFRDDSGIDYWRYIFCFPMVTCLIQALVLLFVFPYQTPKYFLMQKKEAEARELIARFYNEEFVEEVLKQKIADLSSGNENSSLMTEEDINEPLKGKEGKSQSKSLRITNFLAIHLALLQQFVGINAVIAYGGEIAAYAIPSIKQTFPIIINFVQGLMTLTTSYLLSRVGRKAILQLGTVISFFSTGMISVGFFIKESNHDVGTVFILTGLVIFNANFGFSLGPIVWLYVAEIVQPSIIPFTTLANWSGAAAVTIFFPIVKGIPNLNPAYVFLFFTGYTGIAFFISQKLVIETKGKTEQQIFTEFSSKKIC